MKRNRVRLTESQLHRVIKNSVKKVLKEEYDCYEHEEMTDEINGQFNNLVASIRKIQQYYLENCERNAPDLYNSAAGKYGDKAINLIWRAYYEMAFMLHVRDDEDEEEDY